LNPHLFDAINVSLGNISFAPFFLKLVRLPRSGQFAAQTFNPSRRLRPPIEMEHAALGIEPMSQVDAAQRQRTALAVHDLRP
jgi:hypothetical protein